MVVTGGSAGVGRAVALAYARRGARLALLARGRERLEAAVEEVRSRGGLALAIPTDVANAEDVEHAAWRVERELGPIGIWINNAMATIFSPAERVTPEEYRRATEVTYLGTVHGTLAALRRMRPRDRGTIVQVGSALAHRSIPLQAPYCAAKHAVRGFTESLRCELLHDRSRVRLTMVQLPALNTPQFGWCRSRLDRHPRPVGKVFQPEVAAEAIVWAAGLGRREVWVGGTTVQAIGAQKFLAPALDRYLARSAWEGQLMDEPLPGGREGNLFVPVPGAFGARGRFDAEACSRSAQVWMNAHRGALAAGSLAAAAGLIVLVKLLGIA